MKVVDFLWDQINSYPNKTDSILLIIADSELALNIAKEKEEKDKNKDKVNDLNIALKDLDDIKLNTDFHNMNIYELHDYYNEIKHRSWRDKIKLDGVRINLADIEKFFYHTYNAVRYQLLKAGIENYGIGKSGVQVKTEESK